MSFFRISDPAAARRLFIGRSGLALSGAAVALLAGRDAFAAKAGDPGAQDVRILNTALGAELAVTDSPACPKPAAATR